MTQVVFQNIAGKPVAPSVVLDRRRRRLSTIAKQHAREGLPFIVSRHDISDPFIPCDQTVVKRGKWKDTLVSDEVVVITYLPLGGGGGGGQGKSIGLALASIALLALGQFWAAPALAAATGMSSALATSLVSLATAGIVAGAQYLMARAAAAKAKKNQEEQVYSVSGGGNTARPGQRIPRRYGRTVATDLDLTQQDYIINEGNDQTLYKRITVGLGHYEYYKIFVGKATMWTKEDGLHQAFPEAEIEFIEPGKKSKLVPLTVITSPDVQGIELTRLGDNPEYTGPFQIRVPEEGGKIQVDFTIPQLWQSYEKDGRRLPDYARATWQYAECDEDGNRTGSWKNVWDEDTGFKDTSQPIRRTKFKEVDPGDYLVRAFNHKARNDKRYDSVVWDSLRVRTNERIVRPHVSEIALKIRSSKNLGITAFADISVDLCAKLEVWLGGSYQLVETRKAVDAYVDILRGWCGGIQYGAGLPDNEIDLDRIYYYRNAITDFPNFDGVIRGPVSVYEAAATVLGVIRAEPTRVGNAWSITRDEPRQIVKRHVFSRRQILKGSTSTNFQISVSSGMADIIGEYNPGGDTRKRRQVRETFGVRTNTPTRIDLTGITTHDHAVHYCRWLAASAFYRRRKRSVAVELSGRLIKRNDPAIIDAFFMSSQARAVGVLDRNGVELTLDSNVDFTGETYIMFRDRQGHQWGPISVSRHPTYDNMVILDAGDITATEQYFGMPFDSVFARDDEDLTTALIGPITQVESPFIIQSVEPQSRDRINVIAVEDNPMVWQTLAEPIPPPPPGIDLGDLPAPPLPNIPWLQASPQQRTTGLDMEWAVGPVRDAAAYVVEISYDNWDSSERVNESIRTEGTHPLRIRPNVGPQEVKVRAYAVNTSGVVGYTIEKSFYTFKPIITSDIAQLILDMEMLSEQVKADIRSIGEIGAGSLRDAMKKLNDKVDELANVAATTDLHSYEQRNFIKVAIANAQASILEEARVRVAEDEALAQLITVLTTRLDDPATGLQASASYIDDITTAIQLTGTGPTAKSQRIEAMSAELTNPLTGTSALAQLSRDLKTAVNLTGTGGTATSSFIQTLQAQVGNSGSGLIAQMSQVRATTGDDGNGNGLKFQHGVTFVADGNAFGGYAMTGIRRNDGAYTVNFGIYGSLIVTGTIQGHHLVTNSAIITGQLQVGSLVIGTDNIQDNAVSNLVGVRDSSSVAQATLSVRKGSRVAIIGYIENNWTVLRAPTDEYLRIRRGGTGGTILEEVYLNFFADGVNRRYLTTALVTIDNDRPSSDTTRTYTLQGTIPGATRIVCIEMAK